jgi:hypothetical protein
MNSFLVVISHYNAWPTDQLLALLDQIHSIPSGHPFRCRVVVNQAVDTPLELPERHRDVEIFFRENTGYNVGAWDHGWRQEPAFDRYLFLQEECQILRPDWLGAFSRCLDDPRVGLVGESLVDRGFSWQRSITYSAAHPFPDPAADGSRVNFFEGVKAFLEARAIPPGTRSEHLQALIWATRREVLEQIDGFIIGLSYGQAIGSEVATSKKVEALGLKIREVGLGAFRYILHPQWKRFSASPHRILFARLEPLVPVWLAFGMRRTFRYVRCLMTGEPFEWKPPPQSETAPQDPEVHVS